MYARMIVRDFRRNPAVTAILVLLMMLSVTLTTLSAGTLVRLVGASNHLMASASAPHVVQLHMGSYDQTLVDAWADARSDVASHQTMQLLGIDGASLFFDGVAQTDSIQQNSLVVPNPELDLLLDMDNHPVTEVAPGTILLPVIYQIEAGLHVGDPVGITAPDGYAREFEIAGFIRDSIMNPAVTSSKRLAVSPSDLQETAEHTGAVEQLIEFWLHDPETQTEAFKKAYQDAGMPAAGQMVDAAAFRMFTMIGDGMVAAVVILVAALLMVVGMLCLRFSFLTAAEQDHREIGVLRAIGAPSRGIKRIYLAKYAVLAGVAAVLGLPLGLALTPVLTRNITRYMGSVPSAWNWGIPVLAAALVFVVLVLFVAWLLRRLDKVSPVAALSAGAVGRRSHGGLRLHRSRMPVQFRMGLMDVVGRWPTYLLLLLVFAVSTFIIVVPLNSAATARAPGFINYMGTGQVDLRIDLRHSDAASAFQFQGAVEELLADPDVNLLTPMVTTRNDTVDRDGTSVSLYVENGDHTVLPLTYAEGRAPTGPTEIALSLLALNQTGRQVGETLPVQVGPELRELSVVGSYQDITNGGKTAKSMLPTDADEVMWYMIGVELVAGTDPALKTADYRARFAPATVADIEQWRAQTLGPIAEQITVTAVVAAVVALALAALMTALFTRMILARDAGPIAVQRALGAGDPGLRRQYQTRVLLVLVLGVVLGTLLALTLGEGLFNLMFEAMFGGFEAIGQGTSRIAFSVNPLLAYVAMPALLVGAVSLTTAASSQSISTVRISALTTE